MVLLVVFKGLETLSNSSFSIDSYNRNSSCRIVLWSNDLVCGDIS